MSRFEHYRKLALETNRYLYYANSKGYIERLDKSTIKDFTNTDSYVFERLSPVVIHKNGKVPNLAVIIGGVQYSVKKAIMRVIGNREIGSNEAIIHLDGDYHNCNYENLKVVKKGGLKNPSWVSWEIELYGKLETYETTLQLCERLGVSYWAFRNYQQGRYSPHHWLNDYKIRRVSDD